MGEKLLLFIFIFIFISIAVNAKNYYVKNSGNDNNTGLSDAQAWATLAKVNGSSFSAGDTIFFNRGDKWREQLTVPSSGNSRANITYSAYGIGAKPKIIGSAKANSGWTNLGSNIWQHTGFTIDVGNLIFNNEESCGTKIMSATPTLDTQGQFWYDFTTSKLKIYSVGNPATFYTDIECVQNVHCIIADNVSYIILENLDIRYGNFGVSSKYSSNVIIQDCDISYIGGCDQNSDYTTRLGNGVELSHNVHDITIRRCHVSQCYDAGLTNQSIGVNYSQYNLFYYNNIIEKCEFSFEMFLRDATCTMYNIHFENNTCLYAGGGWAHNQRPDGVNGRHIRVGTNEATVSDIYIQNNIFYEATESLIRFSVSSQVADHIIDYNVLYQSSGHIGTLVNTDYNTITNWQTATGQESHSISGDPLFVSTTDFHLQAASPAISAGLNIGLTTDYDGNNFKDPPSVGAYEYNSIPSSIVIPVYQSSVVEKTTPFLLEMIYNSILSNTVPAATAFTLQVNNANMNVSSVAISGNRVRLTLATDVIFGDKVTLSYTKPGSNWLQTTSGGEAASVNYQPVTNNSPEVATLVLVDAKERKIFIYPNPAHDFVNISIDDPNMALQIVKIIDLSGKIVFTKSIEQGIKNVQIAVENFNTGIYIITLESVNLTQHTQKLIVNK